MADPVFAFRTSLQAAAGGGWHAGEVSDGPLYLSRLGDEDLMCPQTLLRLQGGGWDVQGAFTCCGAAFHAGEQCGFGVSSAQFGTWLLGDLALPAGSKVGFSARAEGAPGLVAGTRVATGQGEVAVEMLAPGTPIRLADGTLQPLRRLVRRQCCLILADAMRVQPVAIARGALGGGLPERELVVSPEQALLLGGVLIQAGALAQGGAIRRVDEAAQPVDYIQLDLDGMALVLVEGVAMEAARVAPGEEGGARFSDLPRARSARQVPYAVRELLAAC